MYTKVHLVFGFMPKHILSFVVIFICRIPDKRKAVGQPSPPKRRGRPRRGHEGDSSSQSLVARTQRRDLVGDSSQPTPVRRRLRRGQDGDSSQPPPVRGSQGQDGDYSQPPPVSGRLKRRQVEASSQQFSPTISTTVVAHVVPIEVHEALPLQSVVVFR